MASRGSGRRSWAVLLVGAMWLLLAATPGSAMKVMTEDGDVLSAPLDPPFNWGLPYRGMATRRAGWIGASYLRALVQNRRGFDWASTDAFVDNAVEHDFKPYLTVGYQPYDKERSPTDDPSLPIPSANDVASFCAEVAGRYGDRVDDYSVFNEPNYFEWRTATGSTNVMSIPAATYGAYFRSCAASIRAVDPGARVYFGELAAGAAGCRYVTDALSSSEATIADGLAFHPYQEGTAPWDPAPARCSGISSLADWDSLAASVTAKLHAPGGARVPLMVTEFGYCNIAVGKECSGRPLTYLDETTKATWLAAAYRRALDSGLVTFFSYYHLVSFPELRPWDSGIVDMFGNASQAAVALRAATGVQSPDASGVSASGVEAFSARLNGTVNPHGIKTTYRFDYGTTTAYGSSVPVPAAVAGSGGTAVAVSETVAGLRPLTKYHYRLVATSRAGTSATADATFTTTAVDDQPAAVAGVGGVGASTFARADDGTIRVTTWTGAQQTPWTSLGGNATSGPAAVRAADGTVEVFALWADGSYRRKSVSATGVESGWTSIGGDFVSAPAATLRRGYGGYVDVVGRGRDGAIWLRTWDPGARTWTPWNSLGGSFRSAPPGLSWFGGGQGIFARGTDGAIWRKYWTGSSWSSWEPLGGNAASGPTATSFYGGNIELFYRDAGGATHRKGWNGREWSGWAYFSASLDSAPAAISEVEGQLALFGRSGSETVQRKFENDEWWSQWYSLGDPSSRVAPLTDDRPAAVHGFGGQGTSVFATDNTGAVRMTTWVGTRQLAWRTLGGSAVSGPAAVRRNDGTIDVFVLSSDGTYQHKAIDPSGSESAWTSIGGRFASAPAAILRLDGDGAPGIVIDIVGRGTDNAIWMQSWILTDGSRTAWFSLGGDFKSSPALMSWFGDGLEVFARGSDDEVKRRYWNTRAWSGWESLGGAADSGLAATTWYDENFEVSYRGSDRNIYFNGWNGTSWRGWTKLDAAVDSAPAMLSERPGQLMFFSRSGLQIVKRKYEDDAWDPGWEAIGNPSLRLSSP